MASTSKDKILERLTDRLMGEYAAYAARERSPSAEKYRAAQANLLEVTKTIGRKGDISTIFEAEKTFLENDHKLYANSQGMKNSLGAALKELSTAETCLPLVDNSELYHAVDKSHGHSKSRVSGLPKDAVRQFLSSHKTRLLNMDKSRLTQTEKRIVDVRRNNLRIAEKAYIAMQRHALGLPPKAKERGQGLSR